jgi:hypothetical protein
MPMFTNGDGSHKWLSRKPSPAPPKRDDLPSHIGNFSAEVEINSVHKVAADWLLGCVVCVYVDDPDGKQHLLWGEVVNANEVAA